MRFVRLTAANRGDMPNARQVPQKGSTAPSRGFKRGRIRTAASQKKMSPVPANPPWESHFPPIQIFLRTRQANPQQLYRMLVKDLCMAILAAAPQTERDKVSKRLPLWLLVFDFVSTVLLF